MAWGCVVTEINAIIDGAKSAIYKKKVKNTFPGIDIGRRCSENATAVYPELFKHLTTPAVKRGETGVSYAVSLLVSKVKLSL